MGRRRLAIGTLGGLLLLALAVVWWVARERAGDEGGARAPAEKVEAGDARRGRRIDTATVARAAIDGTVRDKAGAPVAAQVCGKAASNYLPAEDIRDPVCATSGADGRYRLSGLLTGRDGRFVVEDAPVGRVQVLARPDDFTENARYGFVRRIVELRAGRTTDLGDVRVWRRSGPGGARPAISVSS